jgi:hypothetical protein
MSGADGRTRNLPGSFNGFFTSSRHSESDPIADIKTSDHCAFMMSIVRRVSMAAGRVLLWTLLTVLVLAVGALATFLPMSSLPGDFQTDFINGGWIKPAVMLYAIAVLSYCLAPLYGIDRGKWPTPNHALSYLGRCTVGMLLAVWPPALLAWANASGPTPERMHDMVVIGSSSTRIPPAVTSIEHIRLQEVGSRWQVDLERSEERERLGSPDSCVRIKVREGRLGFDWISDAQPICCEDNVG